MKRLAAFYDNAMLYKDLTQWIRARTFLTLFIGLLLAGEATAVIFAYSQIQDAPAGQIAFYILVAILAGYGLLIGLGGLTLTAREFANRTFELYALSGMSLEKMVFGKFSSMMAQFLFGFFCLVPFMFFSYLLGGLDFFDVLGTILMGALAAPPLFLITLVLAFLRRGKGGNVLLRVGLVLVAVYAVPAIFSGFFFYRVTRGFASGGGGPAALIAWLLSFKSDAIVSVLVFLAFYIQGCLLFFYICCHGISPAVDSRETPVKLLTATICLSWMGLIGAMARLAPGGGGGEPPMYGLVPVYFVLLLQGLLFFYTPLKVPCMAAGRHARARAAVRWILWLFAPGPRGTIRATLLILGGVLVFEGVLLWPSAAGLPPADPAVARGAASLAIQAPFFLVFPLGILLNLRRVGARLAVLRLGILLWWLFAAAILLMLRSLVQYFYPYQRMQMGYLLEFAGLLLSPFSSLACGWSPDSPYYASAPLVRSVLGVVGLFLMFSVVRRRAQLEAAPATPAASAPAHKLASGFATPPPVPSSGGSDAPASTRMAAPDSNRMTE